MQPKILCVWYIDDEIDLCEMFTDIFTNNNIHINTYTNYDDVKEALAEIDSKNMPHVCFIDYRLKGVTGDQIAAELPQSTPKYLVTGDLQVPPSPLFIAVLPKPYDSETIQYIMDTLLEKLSKE
jgi:DNA-binding NtrC family response regulator